MKLESILAALAAALLTACSAPSPPGLPPATAASVSLERYQGRWHEIARFPMRFQKDDETATADYSLRPDGKLGVLNTATRPDGTTRSIRGHATVLNAPANSRLAVRFTNWFGIFIPVPAAGNYWVLHVDRDFRHAIVGTPDRRFLWILSRTPVIAPREYARLRGIAAQRGYDVQRLILTQPQGSASQKSAGTVAPLPKVGTNHFAAQS